MLLCHKPSELIQRFPSLLVPEEAVEIRRHAFEIAVSNIDGTATKRLTENRSGDNFPVWSPDGTQIAYSGADGLYTMAEDGSDVQLVYGKYAHFTAWSPDGRLIAFVGSDNRRRFIYTVRSDGSGATKVSETLGPPAWSPDGRRLALVAPDGDGATLYTFAPDGSDPIRVIRLADDVPVRMPVLFKRYRNRYDEADVTFSVRSVSWSPDGSEILVGPYLVNLKSPETLSRLELSGIPQNRALDLHHVLTSWSPDGSAIAVRVEDGRPYSIERDGADFRVLPAASGGGIAVRITSCSGGHVVAEPISNPCLVRDCETLMGLRDSLAGEAYLNWHSGIPIEEWMGIKLGGLPPRVTSLNLRDAGLNGNIPAELGNLMNIEVLDLRSNWELTGSIPPELGNLGNLRVLDLGFNQQLTGSVPAELGNLGNLEVLVLGRSWQLTGSIPEELGNLGNLKELDLSGIGLMGSIPPELGNLDNLEVLKLSTNKLAGSIPAELSRLPNLKTLMVAENKQLMGCIRLSDGSQVCADR